MPFPPLNPSLARALTERGYAEPTPVQAAVLEPGTAGRDLLVSAQTGSGKTVAYGLAIAPEILGEAERTGPPGAPLALVVAPTRELALQVREELAWLYAEARGRVTACVGGTDMRREARALGDGTHIVVGTPGRLRDHLERGNLDASGLRVVVLDEADEMLDMGFRDDLEAILDETPAERRTLLFSATVPREIAQLAKRYQRDALRIAATAEGERHGDIEYRAVLVAPRETERAVVNLLRLFEARGALVFCSTRAETARLHGNLTERGFSAVALSGELTQAERNRALQSLRDGRARVCVATDVAARGIDLPDLGLVIHADLPRDRETLLHRSGRTGRAGRKGVSVVLVPYNRRRMAERLLEGARVQAAWSAAPSAEEIRDRDRARLAEQAAALAAEEAAEEDLAVARELAEGRSPESIAAALIRVLRAPLPAPEDLTEVSSEVPPRGGGRRGEGPGAEAGGQPRAADDAGIWFRMNVGRSGNADPRWILPFLCRRGHVTRREIGAIRILDRETRFEVAPWAAERFAAAAGRPGGDDDAHIRIEPAQPLHRVSPRPRPGSHRAAPRAQPHGGRSNGGGHATRRRRA